MSARARGFCSRISRYSARRCGRPARRSTLLRRASAGDRSSGVEGQTNCRYCNDFAETPRISQKRATNVLERPRPFHTWRPEVGRQNNRNAATGRISRRTTDYAKQRRTLCDGRGVPCSGFQGSFPKGGALSAKSVVSPRKSLHLKSYRPTKKRRNATPRTDVPQRNPYISVTRDVELFPALFVRKAPGNNQQRARRFAHFSLRFGEFLACAAHFLRPLPR